MNCKSRFKKGAASFYIVAFATLILLIIATSFAAIIISELNRTTNDDLAQSAYDSALAGVEDAKLAFYNFLDCASGNGVEANEKANLGTCERIVYEMNNPQCKMVANMIGREMNNGEVEVKEGGDSNNMAQFYTCVKINTNLTDYRATLSKSMTSKIIRVQLNDLENYSDLKTIRIKWSNNDGGKMNYVNLGKDGSNVKFPISISEGGVAKPPVVTVSMVQTSENFSLKSFESTSGGQTNRGTIYLVPTNSEGKADIEQEQKKDDENFIRSYNKAKRMNYITAEDGFLKSNDKVSKNLPFAVYCSDSGEYMCSVDIGLPEPIGGTRNKDTFFLVVSLPYEQPSTNFSLEFFCGDGVTCGNRPSAAIGDEAVAKNQAYLGNMLQVEIDSTGRANDLFRRIVTRLEMRPEGEKLNLISPLFAMQVLGESGGSAGGGGGSPGGGTGNNLEKKLRVTEEHGLNPDPGWESAP